MDEQNKKHLYLIGFMGTGKTTVSRILKKKLGWPEVDADEKIAAEAGLPVSEIFERYGEPYFRDLESEMIEKIAGMKPAVVSCGGGAVLRACNVEAMKKSGTVVLLTASAETVYERVRNSRSRPILNGHMDVGYIHQMMEKRQSAYEEAAEVIVSTDGKKPGEVADEIIRRALKHAGST